MIHTRRAEITSTQGNKHLRENRVLFTYVLLAFSPRKLAKQFDYDFSSALLSQTYLLRVPEEQNIAS